MTGLEIKVEAEAYIDESIDDPDALIAINRALQLIGDMAQIFETVKVKIEKVNAWYLLPDTVTHVQKVETMDGRMYRGYQAKDNMIRFDNIGEFIVHYKRLPKRMTGIMDTPEIHPAFHQTLVTYLIAWWKLKDDDESPDGIRHLAIFNEDVARIYRTLSRDSSPKQWRVER